MGRVVGRHELRWNDCELFFGRKRIAGIEPDAVYAGMWRVRRPDGTLSDMVNISRARDAAMVLSLAVLNGQETATGRRPVRLPENVA
jgi:hypothetical protein